MANGFANKTTINAWVKTVTDWNEANQKEEQIIANGFVNPYNKNIVYN